MRVAAVQYKAVKGDYARSLKGLYRLAERAAVDVDLDLLVLPEMAVTGYVFPDLESARRVAESPQGPTCQAFATLARNAGCWLVVGFPELAGSRVFNSALVLDRQGELCFVYRKTLLYEADLPWATPGDTGYRTFQTGAGSFGVGICMDMNDNRFIDWLREEQPDAISFPTNWLDEGHGVWEYWAYRLQGIRSTLVAANTWGKEESIGFRGESAVLKGRNLLAAASLRGNALIRASTHW